jgi:hypothetical protein
MPGGGYAVIAKFPCALPDVIDLAARNRPAVVARFDAGRIAHSPKRDVVVGQPGAEGQ